MLIDITPGEIDVEEMVDIFSLMYSVQVLKSFLREGGGQWNVGTTNN